MPRGLVVFHTPEEIDKLLKACPTDTWRLVVLLGADAGLRRGEIMNLRWQDVDFANNQLYIASNKTEYYRFLPMTEIYAHLDPAHLHKAIMNLPKHGMTLVDVEEKTVCEPNKACKQVGLDFGDLVGK